MSLLTESGLTPEEEFLQGSPLALNATKITVAGVMPFITDEALEKKLKRFGRFASGFWTVNLGCEDERLKHVQSMNRQVFMYLDSPTQTLEVSFRVKHGGVSYGVYASSGTLRCVGCGDVGQNPVDCPHRQQIPKPAEDDSGEGRNAVAGSPVTASSANPGPADRGSGSITATLPGDHPATNPCSSIGPSEETAPEVPPSQSNSNFSHPVYKEISLANGQINRMSMHELRLKLSELQLDTRGVKDVMKKRLKSHYKKQKLMQTVPEGGPTDTYYDYICVVDFEATCEEDNPSDFQHEIIEFPMVLINTHTLEIVDTFQEYVKPELNPELSDFCVKLTGITQKMVDQADSFPEVLERVVAWLQERELGTKYKYAILTDGAWDMSKFLNIQCQLSRIKYPPFAKKWINIRKSYGNFYKVPRTQTKLSTMLEKLGLKYEGRPHSGLDDSRNIARIAIRMLQDGCQLRVNERIHGGQLHTVPSSVPVEGAPPPRKPRSRD